MSGEEVFGEAADPNGARVVLRARVWLDKVLRDHAELDHIVVTIPEAIETTAADLAPALAAS